MTEIADRYRRHAAEFTEKVAAVPDDRWHDPTPCEDWDALELVRHVIDSQGIFVGLVGGEMPPLPSADDDPLAAWSAARDVIQADLDDPERAGVEFDGFFGRSTFAEGVDRFLSLDLIVHGWDLARATGLDETIPADEIAWARRGAESMGEAMRSPGAMGPALDPPEGADEQTELLAYLGREA